MFFTESITRYEFQEPTKVKTYIFKFFIPVNCKRKLTFLYFNFCLSHIDKKGEVIKEGGG